MINFWQGNQACAEAAIIAGCNFFAGYPITPASEIAEIMSQRLPKIGGVYVQMEDEIGAISAIIGAAWGGSVSMTATSGPGFSLMQENIGYAIMTETPCVIVNVQRVGPSTGQATKAAQGDLMQTRWGTHGDHEIIVLSPSSSQETYELTIKAFYLSEKLRHPVILLSDEIVAHSREKVTISKMKERPVKRRLAKKGEPHFGGIDSGGDAIMPRFGDGHNLLVTGSTHDERGFRKTSDPETHDKLIRRITSKITDARSAIDDFVCKGPETAKWGIISFGSTTRSVDELMNSNSLKTSVRSMQLRTVWPFPDDAVREFSNSVDQLLIPELNLGQLSREVSRVVRDTTEVISLNKVGGGRMIEPRELLDLMI
ncbi:2-oxoacid:acceptor oxidoreductase subunit alpha [Candidatus Thorarchaeota archaeon]|nr:MAG: 2-oxoacid:acceptor oxidoreductase subunit alpha [Candidatus Thorarchaeota archaeon]